MFNAQSQRRIIRPLSIQTPLIPEIRSLFRFGRGVWLVPSFQQALPLNSKATASVGGVGKFPRLVAMNGHFVLRTWGGVGGLYTSSISPSLTRALIFGAITVRSGSQSGTIDFLFNGSSGTGFFEAYFDSATKEFSLNLRNVDYQPPTTATILSGAENKIVFFAAQGGFDGSQALIQLSVNGGDIVSVTGAQRTRVAGSCSVFINDNTGYNGSMFDVYYLGAAYLSAYVSPSLVRRLSEPFGPFVCEPVDEPLFAQTASYIHPTLSAATLVPAGGNNYQPRVTYTF